LPIDGAAHLTFRVVAFSHWLIVILESQKLASKKCTSCVMEADFCELNLPVSVIERNMTDLLLRIRLIYFLPD
jgi:hypothetical protein